MSDSSVYRESLYWRQFWLKKGSIFMSKGFIWREELQICVFLPWKRKYIYIYIYIFLSSRRFFVWDWLWILKWFFMFLKVIDWFNKIPRVFPRYLGKIWFENEFLNWKYKKPWFFNHFSGWILSFLHLCFD